jgi:alkylation response protein AidB-like acyl-CoA dehydrogenase
MLYAACSDYENGINDGRRANMAKYLASCAADLAIDAAIQAHGASAFDVDSDLVTLWPKIRLSRIAPINNEMALNFIGEKLLGLPRSY